MSKGVKYHTSFAGGYLSGRMSGRFDIDKYNSGCRVLENFMQYPEGGVFKAPGFYYQAAAKYSDKVCRLITFMYSTNDSYILEFGEYYIRFYRDWGQLQSGGVAYEVTTPYTASQIFDLQFAQSADVLFITHPSFQPRKLSRNDHTDWTFAEFDNKRGPFLDENDTSTTITPSGTTGSISLVASGDIFQSGHVGSLWQITLSKDSEAVSGKYASPTTGVSSELSVLIGQTIDYSTHGTWTGTASLQVSYDGGTNWEDIYQFLSEDDQNVVDTYTEEIEDSLLRWNLSAHTAGTFRYDITSRTEPVKGVVEITAVTDAQNATATVIDDLAKASVPTKKWAEGAWNNVRGYPKAVTFRQQRIVFANTSYQPNGFWMSVAYPGGDYENFLTGTDDDDAITNVIAESQEPIMWLIGEKALIGGTVGGQYAIGSSGTSEVITPTNIQAKVQDISGCEPIQPVRTDLGILFVEKGGKRIDEFAYSWESDKFLAANLTRLAEDITGTGIKDIAFQKRPERILWCVTNDGDLIGLTYLRSEQVTGWCKRTTDGYFESVSIKPGKTDTGNSGEDEVWCVVKRSKLGSTVRYIERMTPWGWNSVEDSFYVDSGITYNGASATVITGLDHLEGKTVKILADGAPQNDKTVSGGSITLDNSASKVHIGLGYDSTLEPMRMVSDGYGSYIRVSKANILFYKTNYAKAGRNSNPDVIVFRDSYDYMDTPTPLYSGVKEIISDGGWQKEGDFIIKSDKPLPCNVLGISMIVES